MPAAGAPAATATAEPAGSTDASAAAASGSAPNPAAGMGPCSSGGISAAAAAAAGSPTASSPLLSCPVPGACPAAGLPPLPPLTPEQVRMLMLRPPWMPPQGAQGPLPQMPFPPLPPMFRPPFPPLPGFRPIAAASGTSPVPSGPAAASAAARPTFNCRDVSGADSSAGAANGSSSELSANEEPASATRDDSARSRAENQAEGSLDSAEPEGAEGREEPVVEPDVRRSALPPLVTARYDLSCVVLGQRCVAVPSKADGNIRAECVCVQRFTRLELRGTDTSLRVERRVHVTDDLRALSFGRAKIFLQMLLW